MLLLDSIYIHESGGKALLEYFIEKLIEQRKEFFILFDKRLTSSCIYQLSPNQYQFVTASERSRKQVYKSLSDQVTTVFCFANVPPPIPIQKIPVYIYFHNVLLLANLCDNNQYSIGGKLVLKAKVTYIQLKNEPSYQWIVQSERIRQAVSNRITVNSNNIHVLPFYRDAVSIEEKYHHIDKFIYVADGVPQKNHTILLHAWEYLYDTYQITPELHLTIPTRFTELNAAVELLKLKGIKIINHGVINKADLKLLYEQCGYLIFPSLRESFGLPLIEAVQAGCGVLAADLPYVYDVIQPSAVFNPTDAISIADLVAQVTTKSDLIPANILIQNRVQELISLLFTSGN
jgi:glycosyltransferase involved in cell wall biosynthesis